MNWSITKTLTVISVFVFIIFSGVYGQLQFERVQPTPVLQPQPSYSQWDCRYICQPTILYMDGRYNMWYSGWDGGPYLSIGYAYSFNGVDWQRLPENPVLQGSFAPWASGTLGTPAVSYINGEYIMTFANDERLADCFGLATSTDGLHWEPKRNPILTTGSSGEWDSYYIHSSSPIIKWNGQFWIWYSGQGPDGYSIGAATSDDLVRWDKHPSNPILRHGLPGDWDAGRITFPEVQKCKKGLELWYSGRPNSGSPESIGLAFSEDGLHWVKSVHNPVCEADRPGTWDDYRIASPCVFYENGSIRLWFQGTNGGSQWAVGLAEADFTDQQHRTAESHVNAEKPQPSFRIHGPNPFKGSISMEIIPANEGTTKLTVYNILGQTIRQLNINLPQDQTSIVSWDGRDNFGNEVTTGVYFIHMEGNREILTKKVLKVR